MLIMFSYFSYLAQCADSKVEALCGALQSTVNQWRGRFPSSLPLELYTSSNFIGLFVEEQVAETLKKFAFDFAAEAATKTGRTRGVKSEIPTAHQWVLHLSLFYYIPFSNYNE